MSVSRISSQFQSLQAVNLMSQNQLTLTRLQERVAAGRKIIRPSDDPLGVTRLLDVTNTIDNDKRYSRNIDDALSELSTADTALNQSVDLVQRTIELATQGASFSNAGTNLQSLQQEVNQIINQLAQIANSTVGDRYIFSGTQTNVPPFVRTGDDVAYNGTPNTLAYQRNIEVAPGVQVTVNLPGDNIYGTVTSTGVPPTVSGGSGLFYTLMNLQQNLLAGDQTQVRARLDELQTGLNNLVSSQANIGAITSRLELTQNRIEGRNSVLTQQYSSLQDIDLPKLISDLNYQQSVTQASLGVMGRVITPSLLNYI